MSQQDRERAFWNRIARRYDGSMKFLGRPLPRTIELAAEGVNGARCVLEVGAGTGLITEQIAPRVGQLIAIDYADAMVDVLRRRVRTAGLANVECRIDDIYRIAYEPGTFDVVVAVNVLHLVPDLPGALRVLCGVLRPGGKLIAPTFCHDQTPVSWLVSRLLAVGGQPMHRRFSAASLCEALERAGVRVARCETVPGLIPITYVEGVPAERHS